MDAGMSAMSRAFALQHVVETICDYLPLRGLTNIALINREFCGVATSRLWRHIWSSERFHHVLKKRMSPAHRQEYVSKVRVFELTTCFEERTNEVTRPDSRLVLDHLQHLRIEGCDGTDNPPEILAPYVVPGALRSLTLDLNNAATYLFDFLTRRCDQLRELSLNSEMRLDNSALARFVAACPRLDVIYWNRDLWPMPSRYDPEEVLDEDLEGELSEDDLDQDGVNTRLRRLELPIDEAVLMAQFENNATQWRRDGAVEIALSPRAVSLVSTLGTETTHSLTLYLPDLRSQVLKPLLQLQSLQSLSLHLTDNSSAILHEPEMMSLSALSQLTCLIITNDSDRSNPQLQPSLELSVDQLVAWISRFPKLKRLSLNVYMPEHYEEALIALGTLCPQLERCFWPGKINFSMCPCLEDDFMP